MKFGTRSSPRVKVIVGCLRSELVDEMMSSVAKTPIRGESDRFEVDVELLVGDDFVGVAALVVGVDVGGGTTGCLTRRVVPSDADLGGLLHKLHVLGPAVDWSSVPTQHPDAIAFFASAGEALMSEVKASMLLHVSN